MSDRNRDVRVRILSEYYDEGSKAADRALRRSANLQIQATREDLARESQRAAAVVQANLAQSAAMQQFGSATLKVTAAVAIGLGLTAKAAMDWESAWAGVSKTVDGSPEQMAQLEKELRGLAKVLPATHEEIAGVAEAAGQLGVKRADIAAFTRTMIDMGETTNLSSDEAATGMAQLSNILGIGADKADQLGSSIVALGNDGASTERDILSMSLRIAGAGRTVGLTADEVLAMASTLSSLGIEAEAGGTAISKVMLQIDKDIATGSDTVEQYARVAGVSADEFAKKWKSAPAEALTLFTQGLGRMQTAGENTTEALDDMGFSEVRTSDALRRLALSGDVMTDSLKTSSVAWAESTALSEEAAKRYETTEARLQMARNQINDAAIDIGANFLPAVASATEAAGSLAVGFGELPPKAQSWVSALGASAAGLGAVVGGAAIAIPKLKELGDTVTALRGGQSRFGKAIGGAASVLAGPWGLALAGAVIVGGFWLKQQGEMKQRSDAVRDSLDAQTGALTQTTEEWVAAELVASGAAHAYKVMGGNVQDLVAASLGAEDAITRVNGVLDTRRDETAWTTIFGDVKFLDEAVNSVEAGFARTSTAVEGGVSDWQLMQDALYGTGAAQERTVETTDGLSVELQAQADMAEQATTALDELTKALTDMNSPTLDAREATRAWHEQLAAVGEALKENGVGLDVTTEKGRTNQEVLDGLARSGQARASALLEETGSVDQFNGSLEESRTALFNAAVQFGLTDDEARVYVDSVLSIPPTAATKVTLDTADAYAKLGALQSRLSQAAGQRVVIPYSVQTHGREDGGWAGPAAPTTAAADGLDRQSMIAPGGANILWAEPQTGWEAYISGKPSQRDRNIGILGDVAQRFGMILTRADQIAPYAAAAPAGDAGSSSLTVQVSANSPWADALARKIADRVVDKARVHQLRRTASGASL